MIGQSVAHYTITSKTGRCVTVFGSARFSEDHRYYHDLARRLGWRLAEEGYAVMVGFLFVGQPDVAAHAQATSLLRPPVGGLHDPWSAARHRKTDNS